MKIIQIDGFRGLITALFVGLCLFAGFVVFPGLVMKTLWNKYLVFHYMFPSLNLLQGVLLWGIVAISYCIISNNDFAISFKSSQVLSDDELKSIIREAKHSKGKNIMQGSPLTFKKNDFPKDEFIKSAKNEKETPFSSSPISIKPTTSEDKDEDQVSNIK